MTALIFRVDGVPVPQGSKNGYVINGKAVLVEASKNIKPWRESITLTARGAIKRTGWELADEGVFAAICFYLPKPPSAKRDYPTVKPDLDKLVRAVLDGCTDAGVWADDSKVLAIAASKHYAKDGCPQGVEILVTRMSDAE